MSRLQITQVKSIIACPKDQRATVRALGLRKIGHSVSHEDSPSIRGMVFKVKHLLKVEESQS